MVVATWSRAQAVHQVYSTREGRCMRNMSLWCDLIKLSREITASRPAQVFSASVRRLAPQEQRWVSFLGLKGDDHAH